MANLKALTENRAALQSQLEALLQQAETEHRAMTEEERGSFDTLEQQMKDIDETLSREERARSLTLREPAPSGAEERAAAEEQVFVDYILGRISEQRAG